MIKQPKLLQTDFQELIALSKQTALSLQQKEAGATMLLEAWIADMTDCYDHLEIQARAIPDPATVEINLSTISCMRAWMEEISSLLPAICGIRGPRNVSSSSRFRIMKRDNFCCQLCGRKGIEDSPLEVDHIHPLAKGGSNQDSNLWTLCFECNRGKGTEPL